MDELNLSQFISDLEINLGYSMQSNSFTLTSAVASESNTMQVDQVYANNNNIENTIPIIEPNLQPSSSALSPPSSSSSSSSSSSPSSNPIVQPKSIKKRQRYSVEYKRKILQMKNLLTVRKQSLNFKILLKFFIEVFLSKLQ